MPPKSDKETVIFLTNIGKQPSNGDPNYVEKAIEVMKLIIEKKIFLRPNDNIGVMLVGHKENDSEDNEECIKVYQTNQVATWEMVEKILKIKPTDEPFDDWLEALTETLLRMKEFPSSSRTILIWLFDCESSWPDVASVDTKSIVDEITEMDIQLLWIGSKIRDDTRKNKLTESEKVLFKILDKSHGQYMTIDDTLPSLRIFKKHKGRFMAWRAPLSIADISIPTSTYILAVDDLKQPAFKTVNVIVEDKVEKAIMVRAERDFVDKHREAHPLSETISGYMYGRKFVPVSAADESGMNDNTNVKSFEILGFVPRDSIKLEDIGSDRSRIVIPNGPNSEKPFCCLVQAMMDSEYAAIARRVYQDKSEPKLCVLFPRNDFREEPWCLVLLELLYPEDRRVVQMQPLSSIVKKLTKEKEEVVDDFIESMMLNGSGVEEDDLFGPGTVPSPGLQHLWNSLSNRALNPEAPVPPMADNLKKLLEIPESVRIKSAPVVERMEQLFAMEETENTSPETVDDYQQPSSVKSEKTKIEMEKMANEPIFRPEESSLDLDELLEADMDM